MDEQEESRKKAQELLVQAQKTRQLLKQDRRWSFLPVKWLVLWQIGKMERNLRGDLQENGEADEYTYSYRRGPTSISFHWPWH